MIEIIIVSSLLISIILVLFILLRKSNPSTAGFAWSVKLNVKKPGAVAAITGFIILIAAFAVFLIFTSKSNSAITLEDKNSHYAGETKPYKQPEYVGNTRSDTKTADMDSTVCNLLDEMLGANNVIIEYRKEGPAAQSPSVATKALSADDREKYKKMFFIMKGWKIASAEDIQDKPSSGGESISIYDDAGHKFSLAKGSLIVAYNNMNAVSYYKAPINLADDMIYEFTMPSAEQSFRYGHWRLCGVGIH